MRLFEILINGVTFIAESEERQFRIAFEVIHDFGGFNSYMDLTIYNLSAETAGKMLTRGTNITLRGGYDGNVGRLFTGTIKNSFRTRPEAAATGTRVVCVGGSLSESRPMVNRSFGAGVIVTDLITACSDTLGLTLVMTASDFSDVSAYAGGYLLVGDPMKHLSALARTHGFQYLIEGDQLIVVRNGSVRHGSPFEISQFTGMEGIPIITEIGADVTTRLNPKARIGGEFEIVSDYKTFNYSNVYFQDVPESAGTGVYRIQKISHSGDSWGDLWSTSFTGIR